MMRPHPSQPPLRRWQTEAIPVALRAKPDTLIEACPGAGKSRLLCEVSTAHLDTGTADQIILVVPTRELQEQHGRTLHAHGIELDYRFDNRIPMWSSSYRGVIVTYAAIAQHPDRWAMRVKRGKTLVIFDEIHHAGESANLTWGAAMKEAFDGAVRRLLLSGTPFRSDGAKIPWVTYDTDGIAIPDYQYSYRQGVADGVVRSIRFDKLNSEVQYLHGDEEFSMLLDEALEEDESRALRTALDPTGLWIRSAITQMDDTLTGIRKDFPQAGMLIVAMDQRHADAIAKVVYQVTREQPVLVHGNSEEAVGGIDKFRRGKQRWIVAVQMVSEGVDAPRIVGGIYATNKRTDLIFRQITLRAGRVTSPDENVVAVWAIPPIPALVGLARRMEEEAVAGLKDAAEVGTGGTRAPGAVFVPLGSGEAVRSGTIYRGQEFSDEEMVEAAAIIAASGARNVPASELARIIRMQNAAPKTPAPAPEPPVDTITLQEKHHKMRMEIKTGVGRVSYKTGIEFNEIHRWLNKECDEPNIHHATTETLQRRLVLLNDPTALPWEPKPEGTVDGSDG